MVVVGTLLTACATPPPATVNGLKAVFHDPGFAVQGKTRTDQVWISATQETGIRVLGWARPKGVAGKKVVLVKTHKAIQTSHKVVILPKARPTILTPATPAVVTVVPKKPVTTQSLRERIRALNEKVRRLEGK